MVKDVFVHGMGKAGLPLALVIADTGNFKVFGVDISEDRVNELNKGINPFPNERGQSELLKKHIGKNFIAITGKDFLKQAEKRRKFTNVVEKEPKRSKDGK